MPVKFDATPSRVLLAVVIVAGLIAVLWNHVFQRLNPSLKLRETCTVDASWLAMSADDGTTGKLFLTKSRMLEFRGDNGQSTKVINLEEYRFGEVHDTRTSLILEPMGRNNNLPNVVFTLRGNDQFTDEQIGCFQETPRNTDK